MTPHPRIQQRVLDMIDNMVSLGLATQEEADAEILRLNKKYEALEILEAEHGDSPLMKLFKERFNS